MELIDILLPTYNGAKYVEELIQSLFLQVYQNWRLIIRDDCSSDQTIEIIQRFAREYPARFIIIPNEGKHLGIIGSFAHLLEVSKEKYTMFCDQDDIWLPKKIKLCYDRIKQMEHQYGSDIPLLVHTDLKVVDENLGVIEKSFWKYQKLSPIKANRANSLLVQNMVTGCTMLMNNKLREMALPIPKDAIVQDWWLALIAVVFGKIDQIKEPQILYRQHINNALGAKKHDFLYYLRSFLDNKANLKYKILRTEDQARVFVEKFGNRIEENQRQMITSYAYIQSEGYFKKRLILLKYRLFAYDFERNLGWFIFI